MISRRDWQLQQLGVMQWILRSPVVLQGEGRISLSTQIRLIMVSDELPALHETLIRDVLRALKIFPDQVLQLTPNHIKMLSPNSCCNSWRLGVKEPIPLKGGQLVSPMFKEFKRNPQARRDLWQQVCDREYDFFPTIPI